MKKNYHEIICIIDKSNSMNEIKREAIAGFNSFVNDQREYEGDTTLTLVFFNQEYQSMYERKNINEVPLLNMDSFVPKGATGLLDAIGKTVDTIGDKLYKAPEDERPEKVIVAILTDGLENASREYTQKEITKKIKEQQDKYSWEFVFLAANQDAFVSADHIGIKKEDAVNFKATSDGIKIAFEDLNRIVLEKRKN